MTLEQVDDVAPPRGLSTAARIVRQTAIFSFAEMRATHTWRTWAFAWLLRLLLQASFFALVGGFVGDRATLQYVLIGNAVVLCCLESMIVVLQMASERADGTLPLLAMAPTSHVPIYLGRGAHWLVSGMASSLIAWLVLPPVLGVGLPWPQAAAAMPIILVIAISSYCYGCFLASLAVRWMGMSWILLNLGYLPIMAFCGVNVPSSYWWPPIQFVTDLLPVTHGLRAVRDTLAGAPVGSILGQVLLEIAVGAGWLVVASLSIRRVVRRGIATGSLEFGG